MKFYILAIALILTALTFFYRLEIMSMFSKSTEPEIAETRDFQCEGMEGFTFKYPVFKGWEVSLIRNISEVWDIDVFKNKKGMNSGPEKCEILLSGASLNRPEKVKEEFQPRILVQQDQPHVAISENPHGIRYEKLSEDKYFFNLSSYAVNIELLNINEKYSFPKEIFWQQVIESFKIVDSNERNTSIRLEDELLDTAWVQLDHDGNETGFEINFRKTKNNDPSHNFYDYQDYLHQRPGVSGYWRVDESTVTVTPYPSNMPPVIYTNVIIAGDILNVTDSLDGAKVKFKKIR
ncbi:hypothetical protein HYV30_02915 [Candidatus Kaiserbacteria bacterium]|nr:hypothetical protein [Candidatus Kaiserbacteria bacterium]